MAEVRDLNVGDVLGLLESTQEEVSQEVRALLKETFATVREPWLVNGLLEYFYVSNSGRLLDILLGVGEPHDRHLLDRLMDGLKGSDRFRQTCILLYAVRRQPPPMWLRKFLQHGAMRELLHVLLTDEDVPVLVGAVMVVVVLLPALPLEMGRMHLSAVLDIFCRLVRWTPKKEHDEAFQPFLQVAVYSLFHRLYALYPCNFLTCLRNSFSKPNSSACFFNTLKPMMEKVRLHPLLITETKESELTRARWVGLETHHLILECAKLCLDPIEATCEDVCGSFFNRNQGYDLGLDTLPVPTNWVVCAVENNFWSPSLSLPSPSMLSTPRGSSSSVPLTPVFPINTPNLKLTGKVAESPPETAIEATPETTPFTSPMKMEASNVDTRRPAAAVCALTLNTSVAKDNQTLDVEANASPLSPIKKDQAPFRFPDDQCQDIFSRAERSTLLQSKLQQILKERQQNQKENNKPLEGKIDSESKDVDSKDIKETKENSAGIPRKALGERQNYSTCISAAENEIDSSKGDGRVTQPDQGNRRRKLSMYDGSQNIDFKQLGVPVEQFSNGNNDLNFSNDTVIKPELDNEDQNYRLSTVIDRRISEEKESDGSDSRRSSDETRGCESTSCDEPESLGLGVPNQRSMTDLVKNMRTMRLRFLSQCGPPPDLSQYNMVGVARVAVSPTKSIITPIRAQSKSLSCPDLSVDGSPQSTSIHEGRVRKESAMSSLTLSPIRQAVEVSEATTQTEEITVINPYEQLLGALVSGPTSAHQPKSSETNSSNTEFTVPSPHELLDQYLRISTKIGEEAKNILWKQPNQIEGGHEGWKSQVRLMQIMLLLERHKREVHAERNRRLLGRAKKVYALEEQQRGLREKVTQLEGEVSNLKHDIRNLQVNASGKEQQLQLALTQQQTKVSQILGEQEVSKQDRELLKKQCSALSKENESLNTQLQAAQAALLEKDRQLTVQARLANDNELLRNQVEVLQKQVCLMGEIQDQYKQEVWKLSLSGGPGARMGMGLERIASQQQVEELEEQCRVANTSLDAALNRVAQLEAALAEKNKQLEQQQNAVKAAREVGAEQCRAVELRCQALAATNQTLESFTLEQNDRIDRLIRQVRKSQRGKSVCSDGIDIDLELSASPSSASVSSAATSPPDDPPYSAGSLLGRQPIVLNKLDVLAGQETEPEGQSRRKT
ncbi:hamartin-like [Homarus americanus]|nr:hamartin-like [Homarus americanus]XP_042217213.1 hamartin-like [Homarus americanus]XP_042217214.1 hamartin-like [Homarus americanus]XP_042217215.1 hamartin-like [Homarus americanus]